MSETTSYPYSVEQIWVCAEAVVALVANPDADAELVGYVTDRALSAAQTALNAREAQLGAQAQWRVKYETLLEKNDEADEAITELDIAARLKGGVALQTLHRSLWGGDSRSSVTDLPFQGQIQKINAYLVRVDAAGSSIPLPSERVENVRSTNAALESAWTDEREARRAWSLKSEASDQQRDAFVEKYRALVRFLVAVLGEERTRAALPEFPKKKRGKGGPTPGAPETED